MRWTALRKCGQTAQAAAPVRNGGGRFYDALLLLFALGLAYAAAHFVLSEVGFKEVLHALVLGSLTALRVLFLVALSTVIWTPMGVAIGFSPKLARISQPIVQILASFPANFLFPFATLAFCISM